MIDSIKNRAIATLAAGIDADDLVLNVTAGQGARFPDPDGATIQPFTATIWNSTDYDNPADDPNVEDLRVTARSTDELTITRAAEGSTAKTHNTALKTYKIMLSGPSLTVVRGLAGGLGTFGDDSGAADAYVVDIDTAPETLTHGQVVTTEIEHANTGASTLNFNGAGAKSITDPNGVALSAGALPVNAMAVFMYNSGTDTWILVSCSTDGFITTRYDRCMKPIIEESGTFLTVDTDAYFIYLGRVATAFTPTRVELILTTQGTGTETAKEVGLFSSTTSPNKSALTLTKLTSGATDTNLAGAVPRVIRNTAAFSTAIPAGTYLWLGCRFDENAGNNPTFLGCVSGFQQGQVQTKTGAAAFSATSSYACAIPACSVGTLAPAMRLTMD